MTVETYFRPRAQLELTVPEWDPQSRGQIYQVWCPKVIELRWMRNNHLEADELTVKIPWEEGGADPRMIKHARCRLWIWDDAYEQFDEQNHLRFEGICKKPSRKIGEDNRTVELTFQDYTSMFLNMKPFPSAGMPEWTDTLPQVWAKICDHVGYRDIASKKIFSSVSALKDNIVFFPEEIGQKTLGDLVPERFHAISAPTPKSGSDAWAVWQYCCGALGLVSYIDRGSCVVTTTNELFEEKDALLLEYGENILTFDESADTHVIRKGILGKSFDPLAGTILESTWPPPSDEFIKKSRAVVKRAAKAGRSVNANDTSADYEEFNFPECATQEALDSRVREAWEALHRQELKGKIRTRKMRLPLARQRNDMVDVMRLGAGDCIQISFDEWAKDQTLFDLEVSERVERLMRGGYNRQLAETIARNIGFRAFSNTVFHVETLEVELTPESFNVDIAFHNKVYLEGES